MAEIFAAVAAALAAITLAAVLILYKRTKMPDTSGAKQDIARLTQLIDRVQYANEAEARSVRQYLDFLSKNQAGSLKEMREALDNLSAVTEKRLTELQRSVGGEIRYMNEQNAKNLENIRQTVDEKLSSTLENRLSKSYSVINERLEAVYKGIGEVQQLAGSVSDIKKVFSNVKLRGTWGEVQLSALLGQMLSPAQYRANVKIDPFENSVVEYAVILPSRTDETVLLPIDSKFPVEEYRRLTDASDALDKEGADRALKNLERALKAQAELIAKKYIRPPLTADFAVTFLPLERLYAESIRMPGLAEFLAAKHIMACGPSTLGALLTTLQIGYKTAAIEKRSGELWELLAAFKHEFRNFVLILEKTQKKLQEAQDTIESAAKKTRTIERKLKNVSEISGERAELLLSDEPENGQEE